MCRCLSLSKKPRPESSGWGPKAAGNRLRERERVYKIFSVDDHIIEPADVWSSRVPRKYLETAPHVVEDAGRELWVYEDKRITTMGLNAVAGKPRDQWDREPTRFDEMIPGCFDPKARALDMLSQGVLASVCFPTLPRFGGMLFTQFRDKELANVCVRAWNDFVLDEWCPGGPPGMFVPMVICQVWDPLLAEAEIRRCLAKGAKALSFVENPVPDGLPSFHDTEHWEPVWRVCQEAGIPICMHICSSGFLPIVDPKAGFLALAAATNVTGMLSMVNLLLSGVCERWPGLKIVWSEAGIGWIPAVLERCDRQIDRHRYWSGKQDAMKPSEIFRRNMYACMIEEPIGLSLHELVGTDRILVETDYPHSDSPYPDTQHAYAEVFAGLPDTVVDAVTHRNAMAAFDWEMADEASTAPVPALHPGASR